MREQIRGHGNGAVWAVPQGGDDEVVAAHPNAEGDSRVDVVVVRGRGGPRLELRLLAWGRGVGWYPSAGSPWMESRPGRRADRWCGRKPTCSDPS